MIEVTVMVEDPDEPADSETLVAEREKLPVDVVDVPVTVAVPVAMP